LNSRIPEMKKQIILDLIRGSDYELISGCYPLIVGVFISFIFNFYYQCNNKEMSEKSKKNEDASGRIMTRHAPIRIARFME